MRIYSWSTLEYLDMGDCLGEVLQQPFVLVSHFLLHLVLLGLVEGRQGVQGLLAAVISKLMDQVGGRRSQGAIFLVVIQDGDTHSHNLLVISAADVTQGVSS